MVFRSNLCFCWFDVKKKMLYFGLFYVCFSCFALCVWAMGLSLLTYAGRFLEKTSVSGINAIVLF